MQLDDRERGFSFTGDGPLDMRMDRTQGVDAAGLVASLTEREIADLLYRFGEERASRRIAREIVRERRDEPIRTTGRLRDIVETAVGGRRGARIHPATRTFQALRIAVNRELEGLAEFLEETSGWVQPGGRVVVLSFHSLEDRIVKQALREMARRGVARVLTGRPLVPSAVETERNPRSRSAKLRAAVMA